MRFTQKVVLPGSQRAEVAGARVSGTLDPRETVSVSVVLRRRAEASAAPASAGSSSGSGSYAQGSPLSSHEFAAAYGAASSDLALVEQFAHASGLAVVESSAAKRRVVLHGTVAALSSAFGANLRLTELPDATGVFRTRVGSLTIPQELEGAVIAVLGLDNRPTAAPHFRFAPDAVNASFTPPQVAQLYSYPQGATGTGQTIAIIELGGGYQPSDLDAYFSGLGLETPQVTAVSVDGGTNAPGSDADGEVALDIEVAGAMAPGAAIAVYFAPNTDQGFVDAITNAVHDTARKPSVVSISWGGPEDTWTQQGRDAMNAALQDAATLGVTVTIAAGDNGSTDGAGDGQLHVDFPASSPFALACGGTTLVGSGSTISSETVWNEIPNQEGATGGGVSRVFALPAYQQSANVPVQPETNFAGRGVPDVAGVADPATGYQILLNGQQQIVGGTSAVAPQWAALVALLNETLGKPVGFLNPALYALPESDFRDITSGNNDDSNLGHYSAQPGWDPCTGLGSPNGTAILNALQPNQSQAQTQQAGSRS